MLSHAPLSEKITPSPQDVPLPSSVLHSSREGIQKKKQSINPKTNKKHAEMESPRDESVSFRR